MTVHSLPEPQWLAGSFAVGGPAEGVYLARRVTRGITWKRGRLGGLVVVSWRLGSTELDTIITGHRGADAIPVEEPVTRVLRRRKAGA